MASHHPHTAPVASREVLEYHEERAADPTKRILGPGQDYHSVTEKISGIILTRHTGKGWLIGFGLAFLMFILLQYALYVLVTVGVGIWGVDIPVGWGFAIVNFVWWIGIGHAGTLISAILLLLRQQWRTSINRFAEAMTLFAVASAGIFPLFHVGRPWLAYFLFPLPNTMGLWPQFRSPLVWDVFAVSTYGTISLLFWFVGLIPDFATMRDRARKTPVKMAFGMLAMGWRGSALHWHRYETAYLLLAGLATPLVVSVHTVVSFDFAVSIVPGWHTTIFPPYFVAGAIFSGFAMVLTLTIPLRKAYGLEDFITIRHLDNMAKIVLATGLIVAYGYFMETYMGLYSTNEYEVSMLHNRWHGPYAFFYAMLILCNIITPQLLWFKALRQWPLVLFLISIVVNIGMWLERFVIVITSLHRDYLPSSWGMFYPTFFDWATFIGSLGLFFCLLFLFIRLLPVISVFEMRELVSRAGGRAVASSGHDPDHGVMDRPASEPATVEESR